MKKNLLSLLLLTASTMTLAQDDMVKIMQTDNHTFYVQPASFKVEKVEHITMAFSDIRIVNSDNSILFERGYIDVDDCKYEKGNLFINNGWYSIDKYDFVFDVKNVNSAIAKYLCYSYTKDKNKELL